MKTAVLIVFGAAISFVAQQSKAQGCSDAGFCTIGNMHLHSNPYEAIKKQKLTLSLSNGIGDENVFVFTPAIQYDNQLNKNWAVQAKLTANYASGNLGTATGLGDVFLSATYALNNKSNWQTSFLLGTKLPLNNADLRAGDKPLPMQYQSSLGTADILGGVTVQNKKWLLAAAFQQPVSGNNRNTFLPGYWNTAAAKKYAPANSFKRRGDVLLRTGYSIVQKNKWEVSIGMLGIYHLGKDSYRNLDNMPVVLMGSEGLTLNGTAVLKYAINDKFSIGLSGGAPFVVRDSRPDGLTREFVVSPEFIVKF